VLTVVVGGLVLFYAFGRKLFGNAYANGSNLVNSLRKQYPPGVVPQYQGFPTSPTGGAPSGVSPGALAVGGASAVGSAIGGPLGGYAFGNVAGGVSASASNVFSGKGSTKDYLNVAFPLGAFNIPGLPSTNQLIAGGVNWVGGAAGDVGGAIGDAANSVGDFIGSIF
jgi:hypothetical protein